MQKKTLAYCASLLLWLSVILLSCTTGPVGPDTNGEKTPADVSELETACQYVAGCGADVTGGSGGTIYHVTTLSDELDTDGTYPLGSLRYAVRQTGKRVIVFDVAGVINLKNELEIKNGDLTILGQSAPYGGVCIAGYPTVIRANNVVIRFVRFRMGDQNGVEGDALTCIGVQNIVLDHCSFSWSTDECLSCYGNRNFTCQYCFVTESLNSSVHAKGSHGYGGIWGGTEVTFHHNLIAHHSSRCPRFDHDYVNNTERGPVDFVNNVVYNWGGNSVYGGESVDAERKINITGNWMRPGPATGSKVRERLVDPWTSCDNCTKRHGGTVRPAKIYLAQNLMYGSEKVTADNWQGSTTTLARSDSRFAMKHELSAETADKALQTVLAKGGCSLRRDAVDARIVNEVKNGTATCTGSNGSKGGLIDTPADAGGYPDYETGYYKRADAAGNNLTDSDSDGMPDEFEDRFGLDKNQFKDARESTLKEGLSNLEVYLNYLVRELY